MQQYQSRNNQVLHIVALLVAIVCGSIIKCYIFQRIKCKSFPIHRSNTCLTVFIRIQPQKIISLNVRRDDSIRIIKEKISSRIEVESTNLSLMYVSKDLKDDYSLRDYCILDQSTIECFEKNLCLKGGADNTVPRSIHLNDENLFVTIEKNEGVYKFNIYEFIQQDSKLINNFLYKRELNEQNRLVHKVPQYIKNDPKCKWEMNEEERKYVVNFKFLIRFMVNVSSDKSRNRALKVLDWVELNCLRDFNVSGRVSMYDKLHTSDRDTHLKNPDDVLSERRDNKTSPFQRLCEVHM